VTSNLTFLSDSIAAAGTALLLGVAAMSPSQDPAAASAPFDSNASNGAARILAQGKPSDVQSEPRVIEVVASRFAFEPSRIEVTEGEHIRLVVTSADGVHGVGIKKFRVEKTVPRGGTPVTIDFVASAAGEFPLLCSEYCGNGHEDMKGLLVVTAKKQ
jgi:cytochrome c oxidase subunit 2